MPLSKSCIYGLKASIYLASKKSKEYVNIREISEELDIPFHFLTKVLQELTHAHILKSHKGPHGGIKLARPADKIFFMDIVSAIDTNHAFKECVLGLPGCGELKPCPLHDQWSQLKEDLVYLMEQSTIKDIAEKNTLSYSFDQFKNQSQKNF
ncbi:MAG: Rrf2 family transcriptional regulator [Balneolaceae bacterium]|nr:Rrf2 family transcriptional regulator [Balneolaceae bacterium]